MTVLPPEVRGSVKGGQILTSDIIDPDSLQEALSTQPVLPYGSVKFNYFY